MTILINILIIAIVIVLVKLLLDWIGVPRPLNWIILLIVTLVAIVLVFGKYLPS
jgi:hypothetical protein